MPHDLFLQFLLFFNIVNGGKIFCLRDPPKRVETHKIRACPLVQIPHHPDPGKKKVQEY
jgi:hypothetical protein